MSPDLSAPATPLVRPPPPPQDLGFLERTARRAHLKPNPGRRAGGAEGSRGQHLGRTGLPVRPCPRGGMLLLQCRKHIGGLAVPSHLRPQFPRVVPAFR